MKKRYCDWCKVEIKAHEDYYKISEQKHKDKKVMLVHAADMCKECYKQKRR